MVVDFGDFKEDIEKHIKRIFDHKHLNDLEAFAKAQPTAENLAYIIGVVTIGSLKNTNPHVKLSSVTVWEDRDSCATFENE